MRATAFLRPAALGLGLTLALGILPPAAHRPAVV